MTSAERSSQQRRAAKSEVQGRAAILRKLIRLRFGELPDPLNVRIDAAVQEGDITAIESWVKRVLKSDDLSAIMDE
jgi:hypothetical protein